MSATTTTTTEIVADCGKSPWSMGDGGDESDTVFRGDLVADAKRRFAETVATAVGELTRRFGYSRSHATSLLLGEIRLEEVSIDDDEVYSVMRSHGLGIEDAAQTVTVARALRRLRVEQRLSAAEAVDDLTNRLKVSTLLGKMEKNKATEKSCDDTTASSAKPRSLNCGRDDEKERKQQGGSPGTQKLERKCRNKKKTKTTAPKKSVSRTSGSRKRPLMNDDEQRSSSPNLSRSEAVSSDDKQQSKMAKRPRVGQEADGHQHQLETTKIKASPSPAAVRSKRNLTHRPDDSSPTTSQQPSKRSRPTEV